MRPKLDFWFDFASTYSYPTAMKIGEMAYEEDVEITWNAFLLGPVFNNQGMKDSPFNLFPQKGAYMWRDIERICDNETLKFQKPTVFPRNGLLPARICCSYATARWLPVFIREVYNANFVNDQDISQEEVVIECLADLGLNNREIIENATSQAGKDLLRQNTEEAIGLGIFGAPTFIVEEELFWGNDRLDAAFEWCFKGVEN